MQSIIPGNYHKSPKYKKSPKIPVFFGDIPSPEGPKIPEKGTNPRKWQL